MTQPRLQFQSYPTWGTFLTCQTSDWHVGNVPHERDQFEPAETPPTPKATVAEVKQQETTDFDEYIGKAEASESVDIVSRVDGFLKTIEFRDGDMLKEGQKLFTIEPDEYNAVHQQSLSKIAVWESKVERPEDRRKGSGDSPARRHLCIPPR